MKTNSKEYKKICTIVGNRLEKLLEESNLSRERISEFSKIHTGSISRIISGMSLCSIAELDQILYALSNDCEKKIILKDFFTDDFCENIRGVVFEYIKNKNEEELGYDPN